MPNWCENHLYVECSKADLQNILAAAENGTLLNYFYPEPEHGPDVTGAMPEWWNWRTDNWGTNREVQAEVLGFGIQQGYAHAFIAFDSAWSPPIGALQHWESQAEDRSFNLRFIEWGMGFCGEADSAGANEVFHIPSNYKHVEEMIPEELDIEFAITETIAQWESETEEVEA